MVSKGEQLTVLVMSALSGKYKYSENGRVGVAWAARAYLE